MKNCELCYRSGTQLHHVFFGRGVRQISDDYNLTIWLCMYCHNSAHKNKKEYIKKICYLWKIDYNVIMPIMNKTTNKWSDKEKQYMSYIKEYLINRQAL